MTGPPQIIFLYADDTLLYIRDPVTNLASNMADIYTFTEYSGYRINVSKSELFLLTLSTQNLTDMSGFKWSPVPVRYLGIVVSNDKRTLYADNHEELLQTLTTKLQMWTKLPISLYGRVALLKMAISPNYSTILVIYLFGQVKFFFYKTPVTCHLVCVGWEDRQDEKGQTSGAIFMQWHLSPGL